MPIAEIILKAATEAAAGALITKTASGLWRLISDLADQEGISPEQISSYENLVVRPKDWLRLQLRLTNRRGVLFIGPSGAGKSRIISCLSDTPYNDRSNIRKEDFFTPLAGRYTLIRSAVGDRFQPHFFEDTLISLTKGVDIIVLVLAYGYLDTVSEEILHRPERASGYRNIEDYLRAARSEEKDWVHYVTKKLGPLPAKQRAKQMIVVANKTNLWKRPSIVKAHYMTSNDFYPLLKEFRDHFVLAHRKIHYVETLAICEKFRHGQKFVRNLDHKDAAMSMQALRAVLDYSLIYG